MLRGTEVGLSPGDNALLFQLPLKGAQHPHFSANVYCGQTVAHLSYCCELLLKVLTVSGFRPEPYGLKKRIHMVIVPRVELKFLKS